MINKQMNLQTLPSLMERSINVFRIIIQIVILQLYCINKSFQFPNHCLFNSTIINTTSIKSQFVLPFKHSDVTLFFCQPALHNFIVTNQKLLRIMCKIRRHTYRIHILHLFTVVFQLAINDVQGLSHLIS